MALAEFTMVLTSLKTVIEIATSIRNMSENIELKEKTIEFQNSIIGLQSDIFSIQSEYGKLLDIKDELEKKLIEYENWNKTKSQYELKEVGHGVFVYASKRDDKSSEPEHWLCTHCFDDRKKSILQKYTTGPKVDFHFCPRCKTEIFPIR